MATTPATPSLTVPALCVFALGAFASLACHGPESRAVRAEGDLNAPVASVERSAVPPPLDLIGTAYDFAGNITLPPVPPGNYPGLRNVYRLSDRIISGSEPTDHEALTQLAAWGVKTVISVDGKVPDLEGAQSVGMDYVHIPVRYNGIDDDQIAQIAKTFRELEAPFYIHCYHGKHRGPAAAAIGRVALDGLTRDRAIAEMRQWCSTASKYEGLYSSVAVSKIPSDAETAAYAFDFTPAKTYGGFRDVMVEMTRVWDEVKLVAANDWVTTPEHPDVDALQSSTQLHQLLLRCQEHDVDGADEADFQELMAQSTAGTSELVRLLTDCRTEGQAIEDVHEGLSQAYESISESCLSCHIAYRN